MALDDAPIHALEGFGNVERQVHVAHLGERIEAGVRVLGHRNRGELPRRDAVRGHVGCHDLREEMREDEHLPSPLIGVREVTVAAGGAGRV